ncbi:hypothetical protein PDE_04608 [Penicillium oxalicum 114-2]|uniref:Uncharacterized protein n=1 Tax=Penicillium oxalicum (strain 114-2 / CGMCC 5302) TaxID=933388 RepID=S8AU30_PENO1|nr:hypothetical protein PDE_04608 [Penicillium oxalicum 114-2]
MRNNRLCVTVEESCGALAPEGQGIIIFTGKRRLSAMCLALTLPTFVTLAGQVLLGTDPVISKPPSPCQQKRVIDSTAASVVNGCILWSWATGFNAHERRNYGTNGVGGNRARDEAVSDLPQNVVQNPPISPSEKLQGPHRRVSDSGQDPLRKDPSALRTQSVTLEAGHVMELELC